MRHMGPEDRKLWRRFLLLREDEFEVFHYDVLVGPRIRVERKDLPWLGDLSEQLLSLRIDVIGLTKDEAWLIEVKPNAGLSALGQIMAYRYYLKPHQTEDLPLRAVIVTDFARHYMPELDEAFGIERIIV